MEYQKIINFLGKTLNQPSKYRTKNWIEINDTCVERITPIVTLNFKKLMFKSKVCDYTNAYILASVTTIITLELADNNAKRADERDKEVLFKNYALFTDCIDEIDNTQIDNVKDIECVMPMYNIIGYSDNYSKTSRRLWAML